MIIFPKSNIISWKLLFGDQVHSPTAPTLEPILRQPRFKLDEDVILSQSTRTRLGECQIKLRHRKTIYIDWGFNTVDPIGTSAILNFYGPPGTGKTLAAEALAGTLEIPFISLGIAEMESKFMGETAKNIQAAFDAANRHQALLFFDEADTLLGKRLSSVTQGVDNEVNAMRSTLLIELERFEGVAIFATNFADNYDEAFRSRIGYHVHFDLPDADARHQLWSRMLVPKIPLGGPREDLLALCVAGSEGFSGREIRTCMRLGLPKAIHEALQQGKSPALTPAHLQAAMQEVRQAMADVAKPANGGRDGCRSVDAARRMLGSQ